MAARKHIKRIITELCKTSKEVTSLSEQLLILYEVSARLDGMIQRIEKEMRDEG